MRKDKRKDICEMVKNAMLAVQRYPWEQGVCAQALWEYGDRTTAVAMAHNAVLRQQPDGRLAVINENIAVSFHDILDEEDSFVEGTAAMMMARFIYRGIAGGWLPEKYRAAADRVRETMDDYIDEYGIIHEVCGCPHFVSVGTSAESMAAYLMMHAAYPI